MNDGRTIVIAETGSTNADVRAEASTWPECTWLRAERQSAGRGRLGRIWQGEVGNLYSSTLIRLRPEDPPITGLSLMAGIAVHDALARLTQAGALMLKWPNDIMINGAKLAGMLLEREGDAIIVGVGVNVVSAPALPDRETVALAELSNIPHINVTNVQEALVDTFDAWLDVWRAGGLDAIIPAWLERAHPIGTLLSVTTEQGGLQRGRFAGLDPSGALSFDREDGRRVLVHSGDVGILP